MRFHSYPPPAFFIEAWIVLPGELAWLFREAEEIDNLVSKQDFIFGNWYDIDILLLLHQYLEPKIVPSTTFSISGTTLPRRAKILYSRCGIGQVQGAEAETLFTPKLSFRSEANSHWRHSDDYVQTTTHYDSKRDPQEETIYSIWQQALCEALESARGLSFDEDRSAHGTSQTLRKNHGFKRVHILHKSLL